MSSACQSWLRHVNQEYGTMHRAHRGSWWRSIGGFLFNKYDLKQSKPVSLRLSTLQSEVMEVVSDSDKHYKINSSRTKTEPSLAVNNRSVWNSELVPLAFNEQQTENVTSRMSCNCCKFYSSIKHINHSSLVSEGFLIFLKENSDSDFSQALTDSETHSSLWVFLWSRVT